MTSRPELATELLEFFELRLKDQAPHPQVRPIVLIDENLNDRVLVEQLDLLRASGLIQYVKAGWFWAHTSKDGIVTEYAHLSSHLGLPEDIDYPRWGSKQKRASTDLEVTRKVLAHFGAGDGLFFLSGNTLNDPEGISRLLRELVRPELQRWHRDRYWLHVIWKSGGLDNLSYAKRAAAVIRDHAPTPGYSETTI